MAKLGACCCGVLRLTPLGVAHLRQDHGERPVDHGGIYCRKVGDGIFYKLVEQVQVAHVDLLGLGREDQGSVFAKQIEPLFDEQPQCRQVVERVGVAVTGDAHQPA